MVPRDLNLNCCVVIMDSHTKGGWEMCFGRQFNWKLKYLQNIWTQQKKNIKYSELSKIFLKLYLFIYLLTHIPCIGLCGLWHRLYAMPGWPPHIFHCHWLHREPATTVMVLFILYPCGVITQYGSLSAFFSLWVQGAFWCQLWSILGRKIDVTYVVTAMCLFCSISDNKAYNHSHKDRQCNPKWG